MATSYYHDLLVELCASCAAYLANLVDPTFPKDAELKLASEVSRYQSLGRHLESREARVDAAFLYEGVPRRAILIEAQRRRDDQKAISWMLYLTLMADKHDAQSTLIILTVDLKTAEWAATVADQRTGIHFPRHVLSPKRLSVKRGKREIKKHFHLSMLCMAVHKNRPAAEGLYSAIWEVIKTGLPPRDDNQRGEIDEPPEKEKPPKDPRLAPYPFKFYIDAIRYCATPAWRRRVMETDMQYITFTDGLVLKGERRGIAIGERRGEKRGITIGEKRGELRKTREMIIRLAKANRIIISEELRERIERETDQSRLDEWLDLVGTHRDIELVLPE